MRHPDDGTLMALLDGEIPSSELAPIATHLQSCAECRARLASARTMMVGADTLIASLDEGAPAASGDRQVVPLPRPVRTPVFRTLAWAATVVMAAGLGYMVRGGESIAPPGADATFADRPPSDRTTPMASAEQASPAPAQAPVPALERPAARQDVAGAGDRNVEPEPAVTRLAPMALAQGAADVAVESFTPIGFAEAIARLGGSIRLVDGLVPERLEASATTVRVVYPLETGELLLEQRRAGDSISVVLRGPVSAESLAVLRGRVR